MLPREGEVKYLNQLGEKVKPLVPQFPLAEPVTITSSFHTLCVTSAITLHHVDLISCLIKTT